MASKRVEAGETRGAPRLREVEIMSIRRFASMSLLGLALALPQVGPAETEKRKPKNDKEDVEAIGDRKVDKGINFYSLEKEIQLGKRLAEDVERRSKIVTDPIISEYVNRIGQNLVRSSDAKVPFTIKVIDNDEVNAFALPGGYLFINTGIIRLAQDEAELAGVMAHEIAHVTARHGTRQATRGQVVNLATIPLIFLGGWAGYGIRQAAGFAVPVAFLKFSRNFEREADFLGVQYLYKAGYDPLGMVQFFERIKAQKKKKEKGGISAAFRSHPLTKDRIKRVQKTIEELLPDKSEYAMTSSEFVEVRDKVLALGNRTRRESRDPNRPTLKRRAPSGTIDPSEDNPERDESDEDDRPVLKRRPSSSAITD